MPFFHRITALFLVSTLMMFVPGCYRKPSILPKSDLGASEGDLDIGGRKSVVLSQNGEVNPNVPAIIGADILPGRSMNVVQIRAYIPGKGVINVMASPTLDRVQRAMAGGPGDEYGVQSFKTGGALLIPFANRIRGELELDNKTIRTTVLGKEVRLDANWKGKKAGAIPVAMHGLLLNRHFDQVELLPGASSVTASLDVKDFFGHWHGRSNVKVRDSVRNGIFEMEITVTNTSTDAVPVGIGWHPYFAIPSGQRQQARLSIPATQRALVDNYDDVLPTGKVEPVAGTRYDFSKRGGTPLGDGFLDDCFLDVQRSDGKIAVVELIDPAAGYGLRIRSLSPEVSAFQVYAPLDQAIVVVEPQFNLADPYSPVWEGRPTGMKVLKPGESVTYLVQVEVFVP